MPCKSCTLYITGLNECSGVIGIYLQVKCSVFICITVIKYRNSPKLYLSILLIYLVQGTKIGGAMAPMVSLRKKCEMKDISFVMFLFLDMSCVI